MTYTNIIFGLWIVFMAYWVVSSFNVKKTAPGHWDKSAGIRIIIAFIVIVLLSSSASKIFLQSHSFGSSNFIAGVAGIIICVLGLALAVWGRVYLGKNWGMPMTLKADPELVTSGPYKYIRHPIYSGSLLAMLGSMLVGGLLWLLIFVLFGAYFVYSSWGEEYLMMKQFPNDYPAYRKHTWALLPFIY